MSSEKLSLLSMPVQNVRLSLFRYTVKRKISFVPVPKTSLTKSALKCGSLQLISLV